MILFAKSMSTLKPPGGGGDSGLSFPHDFSGVQSKPAEGVQVSGTDPSISAAAATAEAANPTARIAWRASFMDFSPSIRTPQLFLSSGHQIRIKGFCGERTVVSSLATYER